MVRYRAQPEAEGLPRVPCVRGVGRSDGDWRGWLGVAERKIILENALI